MPFAILALIVSLAAGLLKLIGGHGSLIIDLLIVVGILLSLAAMAGASWTWPRRGQ